jgi:hypothetical protein
MKTKKNRFIISGVLLCGSALACAGEVTFGEDAPENKPAAEEGAATKPSTVKKAPELDPALKKLEQMKVEFQQAPKGDEKTAKLDAFLTEAINVANAFGTDLKYEDALRAVNSAKPIAITTKADQMAELNDLAIQLQRKKVILNRIDGQLDQLEKNKSDKNLAKQIVETYLLELDAPAQATIVAAESGDPELIKRVGLAVVEPKDLSVNDAVELGDWYAALAKKPGPGKAVATERAMLYYQTALSSTIPDEKVKKRVELAVKTLKPAGAAAGVDDAHRNNELTAAMSAIIAKLKPEFQPPARGWWNDDNGKRSAVQTMMNQAIPANTSVSFQGRIKAVHYTSPFARDKSTMSLSIALPDVAGRKTEGDMMLYIPNSEIPKFVPGAEITGRGPVKRINIWSDMNDIDFGYCKIYGYKAAADMMMTK